MYNFLDIPKMGSFWIGLPIILTAISSVFASKSSIVPAIVIILLGSISIIIGLVGVIIDSIGSSAVNSLLVCLNHEGNLYGDTTASDAIILLALSDYTNHDLTCSPSNTDIFFHYEGTSNGNVILTTYNSLLKLNLALDVASICCAVAMVIVASMIICCPTKLMKMSQTDFKPLFMKNSRKYVTC